MRGVVIAGQHGPIGSFGLLLFVKVLHVAMDTPAGWPRTAPRRSNPSRFGAADLASASAKRVADHDGLVTGDPGYRWGMIVLGIILALVGALLSVPILWTIGIVLILVGAVLWILGAIGRPVGGRPHYF